MNLLSKTVSYFNPKRPVFWTTCSAQVGVIAFLDEVAVVLYRLQIFAWQWQKAFNPVYVIAAICNTDARLVSDDQRQHK